MGSFSDKALIAIGVFCTFGMLWLLFGPSMFPARTPVQTPPAVSSETVLPSSSPDEVILALPKANLPSKPPGK